MNLKFKNTKYIIFILLLILLIFVARYFESKTELKLSHYSINKAIYIHSFNKDRANFIKCYYMKNNTKIYLDILENRKFTKGDTILIRVSNQDPKLGKLDN